MRACPHVAAALRCFVSYHRFIQLRSAVCLCCQHHPPAVYEPRYLALFRDLLAENPARGRGGRFVHVLSPSAAPPALLENAVGGLPRIGCCAEVEQIQVGAVRPVLCKRSTWEPKAYPAGASSLLGGDAFETTLVCHPSTLHAIGVRAHQGIPLPQPLGTAAMVHRLPCPPPTCAQALDDGTLVVRYSGERRVQLLMVAGEEEPYTRVAGVGHGHNS